MQLALLSKPRMRRPIAALGAAATLLLLPPTPSLADTEAERIGAAVSAFLQGAEGATPWIVHRDVVVTEEVEAYRVLVSGIETRLADGQAEHLGDLSFRVQRQGEDYAFDQVRLPDRVVAGFQMSALDTEGDPLPDFDLELTWSDFALSGLWSPQLQLPIGLNLRMEDIRSRVELYDAARYGLPEGQEYVTTTGLLDLVMETEKLSGTKWDTTLRFATGPSEGHWPSADMSLAMSGVDPAGMPGGFLATSKFEEVSFTLEATGFNPRTYEQLGPAFLAYMDAIAAADAAAVVDTKRELLALDRIVEGLLLDWQTRGFSYEESWPGGLTYGGSQEGRYVLEAPDGKDDMRIVVLGEGDGTLGRRAGVLDLYGQQKETAPVEGAMLALSFLPMTMLFEALIPRSSSVSLTVDRLPLAETSALLVSAFGFTASNLAQGGGADPVDLSKIAPFEYDDWFEALDDAKTHILLERLSASGPFLWFDAQADITVDDDSASGVIGAATLVLSDLDKAMREARAQVAELLQLPEDGESASSQIDSIVLLGLAAVKGVGDPKVKDGEIVYQYIFDLPEDAPATLNGRPLSNLFGQ